MEMVKITRGNIQVKEILLFICLYETIGGG